MKKLLVDLLNKTLKLLSLDVDEDDLYYVRKLLPIHFLHKRLLVPLDLQLLLTKLVLGCLQQVLALCEPQIVVLLEVNDELAEPAERLVVPLANELLLGGLVLQEPVQLDYDLLVKLKTSRLLHLKVLQKQIELIQ